MKIEAKLIPIKLLYFLRFAAANPLCQLMPAVIHQKGIPPAGMGIIYSTVPLVCFITNITSGFMADAFKLHRTLLLTGLIFLTTGICGVYFIPGQRQADDMVRNGTIKCLAKRNQLNIYNEVNITDMDESKLINVSIEYELPISNINLNCVEDDQSSNIIMKTWTFWLSFLCTLLTHIGMETSTIFTDDACFKLLGTDHQKYGQQRIWGTIGMGISSVCIGALISWYNEGVLYKDYFPAFVFCFVLMTISILIASTMKEYNTKEKNLHISVLREILTKPDAIITLVTNVIFGFACSITWTYRMILVEDIAFKYDKTFPFLDLIRGLMLSVGTFAGEFPFMLYSAIIIQRFGHKVVFLICLISMSLRHLFYFTISNPWLILAVEVLNGPSNALFNYNIVSFGVQIAEPGALAAVYAVIMACFSIGRSAGGFVGGILYKRLGGGLTYLTVSFIVLTFALIYAITQCLLKYNKSKSYVQGVEPQTHMPPTPATITRRTSICNININLR